MAKFLVRFNKYFVLFVGVSGDGGLTPVSLSSIIHPLGPTLFVKEVC